ncbi:hypothetical protein LCGC14_2163530 [marine sediment metagenome]|uniref:Uncharacterized protein n=1 Tax=marine sediment metagenome TaxID=412755 RepID=A0A0F9GN61_9ZZZZ
MVYYLYGKSSQKDRIKNQFITFKNNILINPILKSEIGTVILNSFFKLRENVFKKLNSKKKQFNVDDFWIDIDQYIQRKRSPQLKNRCSSIVTIIRNCIDKIPVEKSDPNYEKKQIHRVKSAFNIIINDLLEFQEEISKWNNKLTYPCPRAEWEIVYNENSFCYEFLYINSCAKKICNAREFKLEQLTKKYKKVFSTILNEAQGFCEKYKLILDERFYKTVEKLIDINTNKRKYDFHTRYCFNLGDFFICELLINSENKIYTLNLKDFKLILHFLDINYARIIPFYQ